MRKSDTWLLLLLHIAILALGVSAVVANNKDDSRLVAVCFSSMIASVPCDRLFTPVDNAVRDIGCVAARIWR
jgi:hypothetical protein